MTANVIRLRTSPTPNAVHALCSYDPELIMLIKAVPGRKWDAIRKVWMIPDAPESLEAFRVSLPAHVRLVADPDVLERHAAAIKALSGAFAVRDKGDSEIDYEYRTTPYAHQRAGLEYLTHLGSGALFWEQGTGKTKTAIDYCEWIGGDDLRVLVIAPNTVKRVWSAEIEKHAGHSDYDVLEGSMTQRIGRLGAKRYSIVNCESLSVKPFAIAATAIEWDVVIVDESTRFKTPGAARTKALHKLRAKNRVILSGTPITGKPEDAWSQLHFITPGLLGSWWSFRDRYLQLDYFKRPVGVKPSMQAELTARIGSRSYRVLKDDVLDLPPKVYQDRVVELAGDQKKAYDQMRRDLAIQIEGMPHVSASVVLTQLLRLTQITAGLVGEAGKYQWLAKGNAKLDELDNLLNDELAGEQAVVFGTYQRELEELAQRYTDPKQSLGILYGPTPEKERAQIIDQFQSGSRRLLFAQQRTGGIGITLTAAKTAVYYTRGWSLEEWLQSQDRLHRIGQRGTVSIISLIAKGTVDEQIAKALGAKQNLADLLTGDDIRQFARNLLGK